MDILERFVKQASITPHSVAISDLENNFTYRDVFDLSKRIAQNLRVVGSSPKVLIHLPQSHAAYCSMLATLMVGGIYCPINVSLPAYRKMQIVDSFDPEIVVSSSKFDDNNNVDRKIVNVDQLQDTRMDLPTDSYHELAYVIFTSGSTGTPKGVKIRRESVSKFIDWAIDATEVKENDIWGQFSNIGFDLSVMDVFAALGTGATLVPINQAKDRLMPARAIKKYGITIWHSVPSVIDLMNRVKQINPENFSSLRLMSFCGEPLRPQHLEVIFDANRSLTVFNTYGPTEGTIFCTWISLSYENYTDHCDTTVAVGTTVPGWNITLQGGETEKKGEIVIWGNYIGAGYWENEEETKKRYGVFKDSSGKLYPAYYTGDWAEYIGSELYFRHRLDHQVKIHGYRVELDEIDFFIREYGFISCRSILINEHLYCFVETDSSIDDKAVREYLLRKLPEYSVPEKFIVLPKLPRNVNEKIDVNQLKQLIGEDGDE